MTPKSAVSWHFDALNRDQLTAIAADCTVVIPLGSTEQHGHHLPVRVDAAAVTAIAERAVERAAGEIPVVLTPTLPFGFAHHHLPFGGTISLSALTYVAVLSDIGSSLAHQGFRRIVFLNGHGGNEAAMRLVTDKLSYEMDLDVHVAATSYWQVAAQALQQAQLDGPQVPGHAGYFETSLMLALFPDLVDLDRRPADQQALPLGVPDLSGAVIRRPELWAASDGRTDDARSASTQIGETALRLISSATAEFVIRFHRSV